MKEIKNLVFQDERELYNISNTSILSCTFSGPTDGESPLKECDNIQINDCIFDLRYSIWHNTNLEIKNSKFNESCRAPLWYCNRIVIDSSILNCIKAIRECNDVLLSNSQIESDEFGWKSNKIKLENIELKGKNMFFSSNNINIKNSKFYGKYSFQYCKKLVINDSYVETKDAFWHSKNVTVKNSIIKGEYLGWYSDNLTLINCKIIGIQPLCYCKKLKIINCTFENANLAFEYSEVNASINGYIDSIKNPRKGRISFNDVGEIINDNSKYVNKTKIIKKS